MNHLTLSGEKRRNWLHRWLPWLGCAILLAILSAALVPPLRGVLIPGKPPGGMVAEFSADCGLVVRWEGPDSNVHPITLELLRAIPRDAPVLILTRNESECADAVEHLQQQVGHAAYEARVAPATTRWLRDQWPIAVRQHGSSPHFAGHVSGPIRFVSYAQGLSDEAQSRAYAQLLRRVESRIDPTALQLEGSNLLTNGAGLCLTTQRLVRQNAGQGWTEQAIHSTLLRELQLTQLIVLDCLEFEPTGHVDLFATFTATDSVVIGQLDSQVDPKNAAILDRNAERLRGLPTPAGPLKVSRVPILRTPTLRWASYTGVVYLNGTLLVPKFDAATNEMEQAALATYRRLLPQWNIVSVNATQLASQAGSLHAFVMTTPLDGSLDLTGPVHLP